eukprot:7774461-Lingulodinium_polyedra.AAC.1
MGRPETPTDGPWDRGLATAVGISSLSMGVSSGPSFPSAALRCSGVGGGPRSSNYLPCPRRRSVRKSM